MVGYKIWMLVTSFVLVVAIAWVVWQRPGTNLLTTVETTHIVLIHIDTFRADYLGCYGRPPFFKPNFDVTANEKERSTVVQQVRSTLMAFPINWFCPFVTFHSTNHFAPLRSVCLPGRSFSRSLSTIMFSSYFLS